MYFEFTQDTLEKVLGALKKDFIIEVLLLFPYLISVAILSLVLSSPRICWMPQMSGDWLLPINAILITVLT